MSGVSCRVGSARQTIFHPDKHVEVLRLVCAGRGFDSRRLHHFFFDAVRIAPIGIGVGYPAVRRTRPPVRRRNSIRPPSRYLKAPNPDWPNRIIEVNSNATICGMVVFNGKVV